MTLNELGAREAAARIVSGDISSEDLVRACLARIAEREPSIKAFAHVSADAAIAAARDADTAVLLKDKDRPLRPLHGVPVAIKDIIETIDMPTEYNSRFYRGHRSGKDAASVSMLRSAGAVVIGKTETIEFAAHGRLPVTRNPHDLTRTPGGSSSGSAAAVADMMVPLTLGTQTGGSVIRPASFCGVLASSRPRARSAPKAPSCSRSRSIPSAGTRAISTTSRCSPAVRNLQRPGTSARRPEARLLQTPYWSRATADGQSAFRATLDKLRAAGASVTELPLGEDSR